MNNLHKRDGQDNVVTLSYIIRLLVIVALSSFSIVTCEYQLWHVLMELSPLRPARRVSEKRDGKKEKGEGKEVLQRLQPDSVRPVVGGSSDMARHASILFFDHPS